jgi:predicted dehydrogenase
MNCLNRRTFLQTAWLLLVVLLAFQVAPLGAAPAGEPGAGKPVRIGVIGVGGRGQGLLSTLMGVDNVEVKALCDINPNALAAASAIVTNAGRPKPAEYSDGDEAYKQMLKRGDLDAVIIATPWKWHTPMAVAAMNAGIAVGVEVPAALTIDDCWELVNTSEKTGVTCMMLENWSFRQDNLAVLNMIRQGLLGEIVHCHCAHSHDCIDHWFFDSATGADLWPAEYLLKYNRDQYPTHSVGPVFSWMDIGCGDYLDTITSTATGSFGINDMFVNRFGPDHPGAKRKYAQGDIVTSVIKTKKGKTIVVNYDMQLPRPYDNRWMIQGTRGLYSEPQNAVYLDGVSPGYHEWEPFAPYQKEYDHKWWKQKFEGGHGGTDFLELKLFVESVRNGTPPPLDVYDSVLMSCLVPLSGDSIAAGGIPVKFPDFTRGKWQTRKPSFAIDDRKFTVPGSKTAIVSENGMLVETILLGRTGNKTSGLPGIGFRIIGNPQPFGGWPGIDGQPSHCLFSAKEWGIELTVPKNSTGTISVYAYDFDGVRKQAVTFGDRKPDVLEKFSKGAWLDYPFTAKDSENGLLRLAVQNTANNGSNCVLSKLKIAIPEPKR